MYLLQPIKQDKTKYYFVTITHHFRNTIKKSIGFIRCNNEHPDHVLLVAERCVLGLYINFNKIIDIDIHGKRPNIL